MMLGFKGIIYPWIGSHFQVWNLNKGQFSFVSSVLRVTPRAAHSYPKFMGVHPYSHPGFLPSTFHPSFIALILSFYLSPPLSYFSFSYFSSFFSYFFSSSSFSSLLCTPSPSSHSSLSSIYFSAFFFVYNAIYCLLGCLKHHLVFFTDSSQQQDLPKHSSFLIPKYPHSSRSEGAIGQSPSGMTVNGNTLKLSTTLPYPSI